MKIQRTGRFKEAYGKLDLPIRRKVEKALRLFIENPYHPSLHTKKMQGTDTVFEARVDIHYRFTFDVQPGGIYRLRNLDNHDECLKNPLGKPCPETR